MIVLELRGGLGNQMFQFAAAKVLSVKLGRPVSINLQFYRSRKKGITQRKYCIDIFKTQVRVFEKDTTLLKIQYPILKALNHTIRLKEIDWRKLKEYNRFKRIILDGYFFDRYFIESNESILQSIFEFEDVLSEENKELLNDICVRQSVGIHIRRGDYLTESNKQIYHVCDADYYLKAICHLRSRIESPLFYIFSDDIEWCKNELNVNGLSCKYVEIDSESKDVSEFFLMTHCKHNIIANSTFSWWAAFLNENHNKIVVAPKHWYKNDYQNEQALNLIPSDWITL